VLCSDDGSLPLRQVGGNNISLICDKNVTTQNLAFLSYWYSKKTFADALLTGIVS